MTRKAPSKAQNWVHSSHKMFGFVNLTVKAPHPRSQFLTSETELPGLPAEVSTSLLVAHRQEGEATLAASHDGWQLTVEGVKYAFTAEPNVLGTLVWALEAEAAFENHGRHGNEAVLHLAQHWCGMVQRYAEGTLKDLPLELQHDALTSAAELAPDGQLKECLLDRYAVRMHALEFKQTTPLRADSKDRFSPY
ncbi:hypothetical protein BH10PSE16_BH10PSE16_41150 [soil metagenome]